MRSLGPRFAVLFLAALSAAPTVALADTNAQVADALMVTDVYVSPALPPSAHVMAGDRGRLQAATQRAVNAGVPEKIALVSHYPSTYRNPNAAARSLRNYLDFAGVLDLVSPTGIGLSSGALSTHEIQAIERKAGSRCATSYARCAVFAGRLAVAQINADGSTVDQVKPFINILESVA